MPKVSVIIPVYNHYQYLAEAIQSVKAQTFSDYEIIVVNDGSTKDVEEIEALCLRENASYIWRENGGPGAARNTGILNSRGEYLVFLDADDLILPQKLQLHVSFLDEHPGIGVVYSDGWFFRIREDGSEETVPFSDSGFLDKRLGEPGYCLERLVMGNAVPVHSAMVRRKCLDEAGLFDETLRALEDWDLLLRLADRCSFAYVDALVAKYRIGGNIVSRHVERNTIAYWRIKEKVLELDGFSSLSSKTRAECYYQGGLSALYSRADAEAACRCFRTAITIDRGHTLSRLALLLTRVLGKRALSVYRLKRALFGLRGIYKVQFPWSLGK